MGRANEYRYKNNADEYNDVCGLPDFAVAERERYNRDTRCKEKHEF